MATQIEQTVDSSINTQESLSLFDRFKLRDTGPTHGSLPHPGGLMRRLSSIVGVFLSGVNRCRHQFSMCHTIASQFFRDYLPWLTFVFLDHSFEESLSGASTTLLLKEYINDFSILIKTSSMKNVSPYLFSIRICCTTI
ncbi:MAG: hypothetical protein ACI9XK_003427 [Granulosicoccus sp.]|jgi:hypothetical protein